VAGLVAEIGHGNGHAVQVANRIDPDLHRLVLISRRRQVEIVDEILRPRPRAWIYAFERIARDKDETVALVRGRRLRPLTVLLELDPPIATQPPA
jgi:hypothetical protein